jgi:hypothetical protein
VALVVAIAGVLAVPGFAQAALTPGCVTSASAKDAVEQLYGSGTEVVREERVAGLDTVLALEPRISPGTRHRAIQAGADRFCDATTGFNDAFSGGALLRRRHDPRVRPDRSRRLQGRHPCAHERRGGDLADRGRRRRRKAG